MNYEYYDMNAYKLHIIKTSKFKTITVGIAFRRKLLKEEITIRNLLKEMMINACFEYPSEKSLIIETENLYDLKLSSSNFRIGNDSVMTFRTRFLNEVYTEEGMNDESIRFFLNLICKPKLDVDLEKCKEKIKKGIISLFDNKVKYSLIKLLETTGDMPYSYNSYGYIDDLDKITEKDLNDYYNSIIQNDIIDVYVVGDIDSQKIKKLFRDYFKVSTFHKEKNDIVAPELPVVKSFQKMIENDNVNQSQLTLLYNMKNVTEFERKYVSLVYNEMLGGSANSILFDEVREKNSYAYYVNSINKSYDNMMIIYSGIESGNYESVKKIIDKTIKNISHGKFDDSKFENAKQTLIASIKASLDVPIGIINSYYAKELVGADDVDMRIKKILSVTKSDIVSLNKKMFLYSMYVLEANDEKNHD